MLSTVPRSERLLEHGLLPTITKNGMPHWLGVLSTEIENERLSEHGLLPTITKKEMRSWLDMLSTDTKKEMLSQCSSITTVAKKGTPSWYSALFVEIQRKRLSEHDLSSVTRNGTFLWWELSFTKFDEYSMNGFLWTIPQNSACWTKVSSLGLVRHGKR